MLLDGIDHHIGLLARCIPRFQDLYRRQDYTRGYSNGKQTIIEHEATCCLPDGSILDNSKIDYICQAIFAATDRMQQCRAIILLFASHEFDRDAADLKAVFKKLKLKHSIIRFKDCDDLHIKLSRKQRALNGRYLIYYTGHGGDGCVLS